MESFVSGIQKHKMAALDTPTYESTKAVAAELDKAEALEFDAGRPYQLLVAEAEARARFEEEQMKSRDGDRVRELISVRQNDDHLRVVAPPSIINVGLRGELRLRIAAQNADEVVYAVGRDGRLPASLDGWRRSDAGRDGAKEALLTIPKGGRYLIACFATKGLAQSATTAAYVQHEDPVYLYTERHAHGLRRFNDNDGEYACERCGATVEGAGYCCVQGSAFALCRSCALPNGDDQRRLAVDFSTGYLEETNATKDRSAALDVGGRRLWLSEPVRFAGNGSQILDEKLMAVAARALRSHPGLFIRCEAHSTGCGLECDGSAPCANAKCRKLFGARGGAVGFSRSRAEAVATFLGERAEGVGLAGSRPPMDTKNGRRVEFHLSAVSKRDDDVPMLPDLPPE